MQTSGTCPQLSDGVRKTITTSLRQTSARTIAARVTKMASAPKPPTNSHRSGGHAKQQRAK